MDFNVIITSNGPGELSTWVTPVVERIRTSLPQARIIIALVPCPHSSGHESKVSHQIYGATVLLPQETLRYLATGKLPGHVVLAREGLVLHLGGDQFFSVALGWRTRFPVTVYTEDQVHWVSAVSRYLLRDETLYQKLLRKGVPPNKMQIVGDLMADAVRPSLSSQEVRQKLNLSTQAPVISLLPGSKPLKVLYSTSFMLRIADEISHLCPDVQFILPQSAFTPLAQLRQAVQDEQYLRVLDGVPGKIVHDRAGTYLVTPQGTKVQIVPPNWHYNALQISDVSITLPGTNTAELAAMGIPMVVMLPLNKPEVIPLDGLLGLLTRLPLVGKPLRAWLLQALLKRLRFVALPNQKAQRELVPELIGKVMPQQVATTAFRLLTDPLLRRETGLALKRLMKQENAAMQLVYSLAETFEKRYPHSRSVMPLPEPRAFDEDEAPIDPDSSSSEQTQSS